MSLFTSDIRPTEITTIGVNLVTVFAATATRPVVFHQFSLVPALPDLVRHQPLPGVDEPVAVRT